MQVVIQRKQIWFKQINEVWGMVHGNVSVEDPLYCTNGIR